MTLIIKIFLINVQDDACNSFPVLKMNLEVMLNQQTEIAPYGILWNN